jgi:hypothetical protein
MSTSDWITITTALVGAMIGAVVSWVFFRTQFLADYSSLRTVLLAKFTELHSILSEVTGKIDVSKKLSEHDDLAAIRLLVGQIQAQLQLSVDSLVSDVKGQQIELARKIQDQFRFQSEKATQVVRDAFATEVRKFITDTKKQDKLVQGLVESFMDGLRTMGEFQRHKIEVQSEVSLSIIEKRITDSINQVLEEVVNLKEKLPALPDVVRPTTINDDNIRRTER